MLNLVNRHDLTKSAFFHVRQKVFPDSRTSGKGNFIFLPHGIFADSLSTLLFSGCVLKMLHLHF